MKLPAQLPRRAAERALTLIEIMVAVALLAVIMIALFSSFNAAQRSLRFATSQTDILDAGRVVAQMITSEMQELAASGEPSVPNFFAVTPAGGVAMDRVGGGVQDNAMQDFYFLTRKDDTWTAVGYFLTVRGEGIGTLYRHSVSTNNFPGISLDPLVTSYTGAAVTNSGRVAEGIVHLTLRVFDARGEPLLNDIANTNYAVWPSGFGHDNFGFTNSALPAAVEVEVGIIDPKVYRQYRSILDNGGNAAAAANYLKAQVGSVYLFRQRIPIRNHHEP